MALLHKDLDAARAFSVQFGQERDAAVADNAVLLDGFIRIMSLFESLANDAEQAGDVALAGAYRSHAENLRQAVYQPHPGAALLEQHRKEVAEARNEGLEEAAAYFDKAAALWVSFHAGTIAAKHAEAIRALKKETT